MLNFLQGINHWYWFSSAVLLVCLEVLLGVNFFFIWASISAATTGVVLLFSPNLTWEYQFLLFSSQTLVLILVWWSIFLKYTKKQSNHNLNRKQEKYLGKVAVLSKAIINGRGQINIEDSYWQVEGEVELPEGQLVKIVASNGMVFKVEPYSKMVVKD